MNGKFFDDEEDVQVRPKRRPSVSNQGIAGEPHMRVRSRSRRNPDGSVEHITPDPVPEQEAAPARKSSVRKMNSSKDQPSQAPRRRRASEVTEHVESENYGFKTEYINYIALVVMIIIVAVCSIKFMELSIVTVLLVNVIFILMGVFLRIAPPFVSVLLAAAVLIVGMITSNPGVVLCGSAAYLSTVLALKR
ncbi:MAG: hypothetical protein II799_01850 [Lachnospiraceae bacterium]|nr:hypothetical protein [Lachnospiraceae bacterium]